ncbi:MAG: carbonic anhydrase [Bacteroidota bacterium]
MKFATAINCMDGRTQVPVIEWLKKKYKVNYVDMITEPGPNKILAENKDNSALESIKKRIDISVNKHASKFIAIVGHYDCAGNPVEKDIQLKQILSAIKIVKLWNFNVQVIGLWIDEKWEVCEVK